MNKRTKRIAFCVSVIFFIIGIIVLINATELGMNMAQKAISHNGGSMDTEKYYWIMQSSCTNFRIVGAILSSLSGISAIILGIKSNI